jgi:hypothetical protein
VAKKIRICIKCKGTLRSFLRIDLQEDGSVSIGGFDKTSKFRGFTSESQVEGQTVREYINLESQHEIKSITNPHFTYHPPNYFRLGNTKHPKLFQGLVWSTPSDLQGVSSPWLRFVSDNVKQLKPLRTEMRRSGEEIQCVDCPSEEVSIGLNFNFSPAVGAMHGDGKYIGRFIQWGEIILHY